MFGSLRGFLKSRFSAFFGLFLIMWLLTVKNVEAIIYMGQSYSGWGFFGYGFDNLYWFYQNYAGWIDFLLFMGLFFAIIQQVFVKHLKFEKKTGKMLGVFLGAALSLGLIMFEYNHGIRLLESSAMMAFILIALVIASIVYGFVKKITGKKEGLSWIGLIVTIFVLILLWFAIASFTGLGSSRTAEAMLAGYSLGEFLDAAMTVLGIAMLLGLLFKFYSGDKGKGRLDATGDLAKKGLEGGGSFFGNLFGNLFGKTAKGVGEGIGAARRSGDRPGPHPGRVGRGTVDRCRGVWQHAREGQTPPLRRIMLPPFPDGRGLGACPSASRKGEGGQTAALQPRD